MNLFITWILIPALTLLVSGPDAWFTSNFSAVGSAFPQNIYLLLWAALTGGCYHRFTKRTIGQTAPFLKTGPEPAMTDVSFCLLISAVFLPYRPETLPFVSFLHLTMAFSATVLFFLAVTSVNLRLYTMAPDLFSLPTAFLVFGIGASMCLLILCGFLITSALEIFLTFYACAWLKLFDRRVSALARRKRLHARIRSNPADAPRHVRSNSL